MKRQLLILACSQRKRLDPDLMPAIDRYDGPTFKVLRKFLRECPFEAASLNVYILSAEYGLISSSQLIPTYDQKMTKQRSQELSQGVLAALKSILSVDSYQKLFICVGQDYFRALHEYETLISSSLVTQISQGGLGKRLSELHDWLYDKPPRLRHQQSVYPQKKHPCIRGIDVIMTAEQVLDIARQAIATNQREITNYQSWFVLVDDQRVAPKWLVSRVTSLPVSSFHTDEAIKLLQQLGIKIRSTVSKY